jgi:hypothetical protein
LPFLIFSFEVVANYALSSFPVKLAGMIDTKKSSPPPVPVPKPWRRAILHLNHALAQNTVGDNSEKIDLLGRQLFGHLWTPREPERNDSVGQASPPAG